LIVPIKKGPNGGQNVDKDEPNCASGYADIALICNEELDSALISMEDVKDKAKFQNLWVGTSAEGKGSLFFNTCFLLSTQ
jgi:hypothetical protein